MAPTAAVEPSPEGSGEGRTIGGVRVYAEVARTAFRRFATYRGATAAALFTNLVWGVLLTTVVSAVIRNRGGAAVDGYDRADLVTQVWLTQGLIGVVNVFNRAPDLSERIRSGDVVVDLYRPVDLQAWWGAVDAGRAAYELLVRLVPPVLVGLVFFGARWPALVDAPVVAAAILSAIAVSFGLRFLAAASGFWVLDARGVERALMALWLIGAGFTVPLPLLPDAVESVLRLLPFASTLQLVADVWTGHAQPSLPASLGLQLAWAGVLVAAGRIVQARATRRVVIQGG